MQTTASQLLADIESFLERHDVTATAFGLESANDGHLVHSLRKGDDIRASTIDRVRSYMRAKDGKPEKKLRRAPSGAREAV